MSKIRRYKKKVIQKDKHFRCTISEDQLIRSAAVVLGVSQSHIMREGAISHAKEIINSQNG